MLKFCCPSLSYLVAIVRNAIDRHLFHVVSSNVKQKSKSELLFQYCLDLDRHCVEMKMILVMMELAFSIHFLETLLHTKR